MAWLACIPVLVVAAGTPQDAGATPLPAEAIAGPSAAANPAVALSDAATPEEGLAAARAVLQRLDDPAVAAFVPRWLAEDPAAAMGYLAAAASDRREVDRLGSAIIGALRIDAERANPDDGDDAGAGAAWVFDRATAAAAREARRVLARSGGVAAAEALVAWLEASDPADRRQVAASLVALSGREDVPPEPGAWRSWFERHRYLPPGEWASMLAADTRARAIRLADRERALGGRLGETHRRLHAALPADARPGHIGQLLADDIAALRRLGLELVSRGLERGAMPGEDIRGGIVALLGDADADIRISAALLVDRIAPAGAGERVVEALRSETSPRAAAALLRAFGRAPNPAAADAVLHWLERDAPTRAAAADALLSLAESGHEIDARAIERLRAVYAGVDPAAWTPAEMRLLARSGGTEAEEALHGLVENGSAERRRAAAAALAPKAASAGRLLSAAERYDDLLPIAADALARHGTDLGTLVRLARAEALVPDSDRSAARPGTRLVALASADVRRLAAARLLADDPLAVVALLGPVGEAPLPVGHRAPLARAFDRLQDAAGVLRATTDATDDDLVLLRIRALCMLGRLEEAATLDVTEGGDAGRVAAAWLAALRRSMDEPFAGEIAAALEARFGAALTAWQRSEFDALRAALAPDPPPPAEGDGGGG
ncbi:MAG: hypothetical protein AAFX79_06715 [Planctomycetota bacterium]